MKKIYSLLLLSGLLLLGAQSVWADAIYGWYDTSMKIGGTTTDFNTWSGDPDHPTDLGDLINMTVTNVDFNVWSNANDRGGANMYFRIYDSDGTQKGTDQDLWLGSATRITGDHDFSISWSGTKDLAAAVELTLEEGETYYIDMWAKTYGNSGDEWYNNNSANFHAKFTYAPNRTVTIGATGWTTFSSSVVRNLGSMTASTGTVTAFYASSTNASSVTMTSTTSTIAAGEGIMLKGTAGATITIPAAASGSSISGNLLVGCPTGATVNYNDGSGYNYVLVSNNGTPEFQHIVSGTYGSVTISAGKAYLALGANPSGSAPSAFRIVEEGNNATDIQNIEANETAVKFIENGKLFVKKNGVVYDMVGAIVR